MKQWFVAVDKSFKIPHSEITGVKSGDEVTLKQLMRTAVESGDIEMSQNGFRKTYFHWIDNLHDWCISRQIWFGHRIPVWYKGEDIYCGSDAPDGEDWEQDPDVLDTWFSSALWTFSTLGWPEKTKDMGTFHPNAFMSPAYEILPLWVSRMILMSSFHLGQVPFKKVLIHGLVRDKSGRKFSKSLGNGIDPLDLVSEYGADAVRMGLLVGTAIGNDINFDESKVKGYKHFANKLWNITRFILENHNEGVPKTLPDKAIGYLDELKHIVAEVTTEMEKYHLYLASEKLYHYIWHRVADQILEETKEVFASDEEDAKIAMSHTLNVVLTTSLKLLHPFMPFVTETIWQAMPEKDAELLMVARWPSASDTDTK